MSFTGSPEVGRLVAEACGRNLTPVKLELGGKGAAVVFDDVDVKRRPPSWSARSRSTPARSAATPRGGSCIARSTTQFVDECAKRMKQVRVGYQMQDSTQMGPVVNEKQRKRVLSYLEKGREGRRPPDRRRRRRGSAGQSRPLCEAGIAGRQVSKTWRPARRSLARWRTWPTSRAKTKPSRW